ncbi:MAG: hypothetical protein CMM07_27505 [Rhodopirellula sp.]|nr:hypothetical protein [Rhodopirellula sp.]
MQFTNTKKASRCYLFHAMPLPPRDEQILDQRRNVTINHSIRIGLENPSRYGHLLEHLAVFCSTELKQAALI